MKNTVLFVVIVALVLVACYLTGCGPEQPFEL